MIQFRIRNTKLFKICRSFTTFSVQYNEYPNCKNCIHLQPRLFEEYNRCEKFRAPHFITNENDFEYAEYARHNEDKCGKEAKYFVFDSTIQ
jgi:hypothetical protein